MSDKERAAAIADIMERRMEVSSSGHIGFGLTPYEIAVVVTALRAYAEPAPLDVQEAVARAICTAMGYDPDGNDDDVRLARESPEGWKNWMSFVDEYYAAITVLKSFGWGPK